MMLSRDAWTTCTLNELRNVGFESTENNRFDRSTYFWQLRQLSPNTAVKCEQRDIPEAMVVRRSEM